MSNQSIRRLGTGWIGLILEQECAGAIRQHPAQKILLEGQLRSLPEFAHLPVGLGRIAGGAEDDGGDFRAGGHGVGMLAGPHGQPGILQGGGAGHADPGGGDHLAGVPAQLTVNHHAVAGHELIGDRSPRGEAGDVVDGKPRHP